MGYVLCFAPCVGCSRTFGFNPDRVPSLRVNGIRYPVCKTYFELRQAYRRQHGLPKETLMPGAYDPAPELPEGNLG